MKKKNNKAESSEEADRLISASDSVFRGRIGKRTYSGYLWESFRSSSLTAYIRRGFLLARKISLISAIITAVTAIITAVEASAVFLLIGVVYVAALPFIVLFGGGALLIGIARGNNRRTKLISRLSGRRVTVFFPARGTGFNKSVFFKGNLSDIAAGDTDAVIVVSPYFWSSRGLGGKGFFNSFRAEKKNLYIVRRRFWFSLRRKVIEKYSGELVLIS